MPAGYFARFVDEAVADYARDTVLSGRWAKQEAAANSRAELDRFLPQGVATPDHDVCLVESDDGKDTVGTVWFAEVVRNGQRIVYVYDLRIYEGFRRRGYASAALRLVEARASEKRLAAVALHVFAHNAPARALYAKLGFTAEEGFMVKRLSVTEPAKMRRGERGDAVTIAALATQVFLDTYATDGVRPDLAREAFGVYSEEVFLARLAEPGRRFILAERDAALVGFAELLCQSAESPVEGVRGFELVRLYVQPAAQRRGFGRALLAECEAIALAARVPALWLTVWEGNARARAFYERVGFADVGPSTYAFEGRVYGNRVVVKRLRRE